MDFKRISAQARKLIDRRGGTESVKGDLDELKDIARGKGSMSDKAKAAADAIKEPGKPGQGPMPRPTEPAADAEPTSPQAPGA